MCCRFLSPQLEPTGILRMIHRLETMSVEVGQVLPAALQRKACGAAIDLIDGGTFRASLYWPEQEAVCGWVISPA